MVDDLQLKNKLCKNLNRIENLCPGKIKIIENIQNLHEPKNYKEGKIMKRIK